MAYQDILDIVRLDTQRAILFLWARWIVTMLKLYDEERISTILSPCTGEMYLQKQTMLLKEIIKVLALEWPSQRSKSYVIVGS